MVFGMSLFTLLLIRLLKRCYLYFSLAAPCYLIYTSRAPTPELASHRRFATHGFACHIRILHFTCWRGIIFSQYFRAFMGEIAVVTFVGEHHLVQLNHNLKPNKKLFFLIYQVIQGHHVLLLAFHIFGLLL